MFQESFTGAINAVNHVIRLNFGSIDVNICPAMSLLKIIGGSDIIHKYNNLGRNDKRRIVSSASHQVMYEVKKLLQDYLVCLVFCFVSYNSC